MPSKKSVTVAGVAAAALTMLAIGFATVANAANAAAPNKFHVQRVISKQFVGPLQFTVRGKSVFVADSFTSTLQRAGSKRIIAKGGNPQKGGDLTAVATAAGGEIAFLAGNGSHSNTKFVLLKKGKRSFVRNLAKFEANNNPDHSVHYGVSNPSACVRKSLTKAHFPVSYRGEKDSHPYALASLGNHNWAVADAGGNDILNVNDSTGAVSVLAVLPSTPLKITKKLQQTNHLASCTVGVVYQTEGVPTDVEKGPNGTLYVTSLPGGPEGPGVPARGRVYTVSPTGAVTMIGRGFADATNLAVTPQGKVYVVELGKGRISAISHGKPKPVFSMPGLVAVEWAHNHLYASTAPALSGAHDPGEILLLKAN